LSIPSIPEPARLIVSVLTAREGILSSLVPQLEEQFGILEETVGPLDFEFTSYYDSELGPGIRRWILSFTDLLSRDNLATVKLFTNGLEQKYSVNEKRMINLDPGFLTLGNFVLATGKNNAHRIYLSDGIFADLTLIFRAKTFQPLEWTYPDYADHNLIAILNALREKYKRKLMGMV
jgi:hypothetical protein